LGPSKRKLYLIRLYVTLACCVGPAVAAQRPIVKLLSVPIAMRDGVRLSTNVFLASERARVPAILLRTPYGKGADITPYYQAFVEHGYAIVVEDVRGRYESEGAFQPLTQEVHDGDDTLNWIARQSWSNGKIGMMGGSYVGGVQWKAALANNPHLKAIFPVVSGNDDYRDRYYSTGGALKLGHRLGWMAENLRAPGYHQDFSQFVLHLPVRSADLAALGWVSPMYQEVMEHPSFDAFWRAISPMEQLDKVRVPVFAVGGWYDGSVQSDLEAFTALRKRSGVNRVLVGPWAHNMSVPFEHANFGAGAHVPVRELQMEWFDQWLMGRDSPLLSKPPVKIFVMGSNIWREEREWPLSDARPKSFYLESAGAANSLAGDGVLGDKPPRKATAADQFVFDPYSPVPTRGGAVCCNPKVFPWGPMDQRPVEVRKDVLVYTTRPLKHPVEAIGSVQAVLYVASSARDTDFTAKLVDVFPDGEARNLTDGILRLRYRNSLEKPELAKPGEIYRVTVDAGVTANVFLKGHRIRLEISSSNFPRFDRNSNTGGAVEQAAKLVKASQTVYHDSAHPSCLVLMVMPGKG
jgi:putative CocE/NonD family hydrolase